MSEIISRITVTSLLAFLTSSTFMRILAGVSSSLMVLSLWVIFCLAPSEAVMGDVQRVFYYHVSSAICCYIYIGILFASSIGYLCKRAIVFDSLADAAASIAFLFASIVLLTGMIWGKAAWNVWWRWEPRLVSFMVLWFMLLSYRLLRVYSEKTDSQERIAAVLGVVLPVNIPLVVLSVHFMERSNQLHPQVLAERGLGDSMYVYTFLFALVALVIYSFYLYGVKLTNVLLKREVRDLTRKISEMRVF